MFDEKEMKEVAAIAAMVFGYALKDAFERELPEQVKKQLGENLEKFATKVGKSLAKTFVSFLNPTLNELMRNFVEYIEGSDVKEYMIGELDKRMPKFKEYMISELDKRMPKFEKMGKRIAESLIPKLRLELEAMLDKTLRYRRIRIPLRWWLKLFFKDDRLEIV